MSNFGFIMTRHVNSATTNNYWNQSIRCIRRLYPDTKIVVIDDNSNYEYITEETLYKTTIINSEYPKRGELLPYIYFLKKKLF